jgi:hypothetical protein
MKPQVGDRIRTTGPLMFGPSRPGELDPCSPPVGSTGTVDWVNDDWRDGDYYKLFRQFGVKWDTGIDGPGMLVDSDPFEIKYLDDKTDHQLLEEAHCLAYEMQTEYVVARRERLFEELRRRKQEKENS